MPQYFFRLTTNEVSHGDERIDYDDDASAWHDAKRSLATYAAVATSTGDDRHAFSILVSNALREPIYFASLALDGRPIRA